MLNKKINYNDCYLKINFDTNSVDLGANGVYEIRGAGMYWYDSAGKKHTNDEYTIADISENIVEVFGAPKDEVKIMLKDGEIECVWRFLLSAEDIEVRLAVCGDNVEVGRICPLCSEELAVDGFNSQDQESEKDIRVLAVPFDNDKWDRFKSLPYSKSETSYGVTAVYDEESREGLVVGAVEYDLWKVGIKSSSNAGNCAGRLEIIAGVADENTRDYGVSHGVVSGECVCSPYISIIHSLDWRKGLIRFGEICERRRPRLKWDSNLILGWNSWTAYMTEIDFDKYVHASDTVAKFMNDCAAKGQRIYINFDAFWNKLGREKLKEAVERVKSNGHVPGIYFAPLAGWGGLENMGRPVTNEFGDLVEVEGYENITWNDLLLRDKNGNILHEIAGGYPLDVTHPVLLEKIRQDIEIAAELGFGYAKIDFLGHGAVEGEHMRKDVQTGVKAYNFIMDYISKLCVKVGMFISLSIAPLFPGGYGHARRICCDVFGELKDSEYGLNALTYGFWENGTIYEFTDPDHVCLSKSELEAKMRFISSAISGTMLIWSDKTTDEAAAERAEKWYSNRELMKIASLHKTFMPVDSGVGDRAAEKFMLEKDGGVYLAVFNFEKKAKEFNIGLGRLGLGGGKYKYRDILTGDGGDLDGDININLGGMDCAILDVDQA